MKLKYCLVLLSLASYLCVSAQDTKKGYLIDRSNKRTEVFFKYADFTDNEAIKYKLSESDNYQTIDIANVIEYGIGDDYKFVKKTVKHDKMFTEIATLKEPVLVSAELFLNVIEEGDVNLYCYFDKGRMKFFYEVKDSNDGAIQFIYRKYSNDNKYIKENTYFRNQLNDILKCETLQISDFINLKYKKEDFLKILQKYNSCKKNEPSKVYENKSAKKLKLKYAVTAGVYQNNFSVEFYKGETEKVNKTTFGLGGEVAFIFPSEKMEIFLGAEYGSSYSGESNYKYASPSSFDLKHKFALESSFLNINIGARYNFIINNKNKIFIEGSLLVSRPFDDIEYTINYPEDTNLELKYLYQTKTSFSMNFGIGYTFNNKLSASLKIDTNRDIFGSDVPVKASSNFSRTGLNLKYTLN